MERPRRPGWAGGRDAPPHLTAQRELDAENHSYQQDGICLAIEGMARVSSWAFEHVFVSADSYVGPDMVLGMEDSTTPDLFEPVNLDPGDTCEVEVESFENEFEAFLDNLKSYEKNVVEHGITTKVDIEAEPEQPQQQNDRTLEPMFARMWIKGLSSFGHDYVDRKNFDFKSPQDVRTEPFLRCAFGYRQISERNWEEIKRREAERINGSLTTLAEELASKGLGAGTKRNPVFSQRRPEKEKTSADWYGHVDKGPKKSLHGSWRCAPWKTKPSAGKQPDRTQGKQKQDAVAQEGEKTQKRKRNGGPARQTTNLGNGDESYDENDSNDDDEDGDDEDGDDDESLAEPAPKSGRGSRKSQKRAAPSIHDSIFYNAQLLCGTITTDVRDEILAMIPELAVGSWEEYRKVQDKCKQYPYENTNYISRAVNDAIEFIGGRELWKRSTSAQRDSYFRSTFKKYPRVISEFTWWSSRVHADFRGIWSYMPATENVETFRSLLEDKFVELCEMCALGILYSPEGYKAAHLRQWVSFIGSRYPASITYKHGVGRTIFLEDVPVAAHALESRYSPQVIGRKGLNAARWGGG